MQVAAYLRLHLTCSCADLIAIAFQAFRKLERELGLIQTYDFNSLPAVSMPPDKAKLGNSLNHEKRYEVPGSNWAAPGIVISSVFPTVKDSE